MKYEHNVLSMLELTGPLELEEAAKDETHFEKNLAGS